MEKVVVTIPAWFTDSQKTATKKAAELAGINLKCLLQEPIAAAIAYNERFKFGNSKLLVFDFGGGFQTLYDEYKICINRVKIKELLISVLWKQKIRTLI